MIFLLLLLLGCPKATPPNLYPVDLPPMVERPAFGWEAATDDCPAVVPYLPGEQPDALCRGLILPEEEYAWLLNQETAADYWEPRAMICQEGRERDRLHSQAAYNALWTSGRALERENTGLRVSGGALGVTLFVVGTGVGIGAAKVGGL
tara:strand:+ start:9416 stop:9862 length:447 start_codon:yes stop_codon:yes gene_type:complete